MGKSSRERSSLTLSKHKILKTLEKIKQYKNLRRVIREDEDSKFCQHHTQH